jgi:Polysaccharide pyruvyl transferase
MPPARLTPAHAVFGLRTPNLGDDLQALAAATISPHVSSLIDRERIGWRQVAEPHVFVMNFWFMSKGYRWAPHETILPIFHGFCIGRDEVLKYRWVDYLRRHQPIGCRDEHSVELLRAKGIEAFWTGCITLFLGRYVEPVPREKRKGILFVDVPPEAEALIPDDIKNRAERLTNNCPPSIRDDPLARWARIAAITDRLRHAELVVTRRLHTVLPCVGFQTPFVLTMSNQWKDLRRFSGYQDFMPRLTYGPGESGAHIAWNEIKPVALLPEQEAYFEKLLRRMKAVFGSLNEQKAPAFACRNRFRIPNPGLGEMPGMARIRLGIKDIIRLPQRWSDRFIDLEVEGFAGFERFDVPVELQGFKQREWKPAGQLREFADGNVPAAPAVP